MITLFQLPPLCNWVVESCAKVPSIQEFWWKLQIRDTEVGLYDTNLKSIMLYLLDMTNVLLLGYFLSRSAKINSISSASFRCLAIRMLLAEKK